LKQSLLLFLFAGFCLTAMQAQQTKPDPCGDLRSMFDQALYRLDSMTGNQIALQKQSDSLRRDIIKSGAEIKNILKDNAATKTGLESAKKLVIEQRGLITEQAEEIKRLESEVKRLSKKSSG